MSQSAEDPFTEALGIYVGPAGYEEVVEALTSVPPTSSLIARIETPEGIQWRQGAPVHYIARDEDDEDDVDLFLLVRGRGSEGLGIGAMWRDVSFAFYLADWEVVPFEAERYSGGVRLRLRGDRTITLAVWHGILHETESGDLAPGFGDFRKDFRIEQEGEG